MSLIELCTEEEWRAAYGTRKQLEIFQPVLEAFRSSKPTAIDICCCGTVSHHAGHFARRICIAFHGVANERFCVEFQKGRDADMFVQWSETYLRLHGAQFGLLDTYENLPEPVIYGLAAEKRQQEDEQICLGLAQSLSPISTTDAWI